MKKFLMIIPILISLCLLLSGYEGIMDCIAINAEEMSTIGTVIYSEYNDVSEATQTIIVYRDESGQRFEHETSVLYDVGQHLKMKYQKSNPSNAFVADSPRHFVEIIFKILIGLLVLFSVVKKLKNDDFDTDDVDDDD